MFPGITRFYYKKSHGIKVNTQQYSSINNDLNQLLFQHHNNNLIYNKQQQHVASFKLYQIYNMYINILKYASLPLCP